MQDVILEKSLKKRILGICQKMFHGVCETFALILRVS